MNPIMTPKLLTQSFVLLGFHFGFDKLIKPVICSIMPLIIDTTNLIRKINTTNPEFPKAEYSCSGLENCDYTDIRMSKCKETHLAYIKRLNSIITEKYSFIFQKVDSIHFVSPLGNLILKVDLPKPVPTKSIARIDLGVLETWENNIYKTVLFSAIVAGLLW